jgi:chromate transporter
MKILFELFWVCFKSAAFTYGGGYVMFMILKKEMVEKRKWITEQELLDFYAIGAATPGIIAVNVATFAGYNVKGKTGGVIATLGMIAPSILIVSLVATFLKEFVDNQYFVSALNGIKVVVVAILATAVIDIAKKDIRSIKFIFISVLSFVLSYFLGWHLIPVVVISAALGFALNYKEYKKAHKK